MHMAETLQITHTILADRINFQDMSGAEWYKVANSGSRDQIATRTDGRFMVEIEDWEISVHSDQQGSDRKFSFTIAIYNYLSYQYSTKRLQQLQD